MEEKEHKKRGWIFDQLMIVGSLEAGMNHNDEEICYIYDQLAYEEDEKTITKLTDQLNANREILDKDYFNRVDALNQVFNEIPNSDRHYYCQIKHRCATYVMAAENYHARHEDSESEKILIEAGMSLALTCSLAFGFEPMECLRCLSDSLASKLGIEVKTEKNNGETIAL